MTMTPGELAILNARLDAARSYLEFGAGASTVLAARRPALARIDSVESSALFVDEHVRPHPEVQSALADHRLRFTIVNIGPTADWGAPVDSSARHLWPNYPLSIFTQASDHDLVLIDGRFRVACTLASILSTPANCTIMIHDFWNRVQYHAVLPFLTLDARADTLAIFRKRADINIRRVQRLLAEYQYLPSDVPPRLRLAHAVRRRLTRPR